MTTVRSSAKWRAKWIWSVGPTKRPFHVTYFRKTFDLVKREVRARIHCAADSKYRLWVNGECIGFGPARGQPERPYYDTHVVGLRRGPNTVAFLVQHYADTCPVFASVQGGLICQVEVAGDVVQATDRSWRALSSEAYTAIDGGIFPERFDARAEPKGWQRPDFDAAKWPVAQELRRSKLAPPHKLLPRPIPLIREKRLTPNRLLHISLSKRIDSGALAGEKDVAASLWQAQQDLREGVSAAGSVETPCSWQSGPLSLDVGGGEAAYLILDFGTETLACPEIAVRGPAGTILDLGYSECLEDNCVATLRQGVRQSERIILQTGETRHRINQPRGFRFMILRAANVRRRRCSVVLEDVAAYEAIYPAKALGRFKCSDPVLTRIYGLAARTVNLCMEDAYTDCLWRERSQWLGDLQPEALFSYYCFGAFDLARKAVLELSGGNTEQGWIPGIYPASERINLPTWGMRVPVIAWEYYLYSGDREALPALYDCVRKQMSWLARYENRHAVLVGLPGWCFVDWTKLDSHHNDGVVQGWYLEALEHSAKLAREVGDRKGLADFRRRAVTLRESLAKLYWSTKRRAFLKYRPDIARPLPGVSSDLIGQHENFLFSLLKVGTRSQRRQALDAVAGVTGLFLPNLGDYQSRFGTNGQGGNFLGEEVVKVGTPFWSFYALLSLLEANRVLEALEYMRLCWGIMLEHGATTCWEMWDRHTSLCHGWSAAPAMILPAYVLGIRPEQPGFRLFNVRPHPGSLSWARGAVPTPRGTIGVEWEAGADRLVLDLSVPEGLSARVFRPKGGRTGWRLAEVDGTVTSSVDKRILGDGAHEVIFRNSG